MVAPEPKVIGVTQNIVSETRPTIVGDVDFLAAVLLPALPAILPLLST